MPPGIREPPRPPLLSPFPPLLLVFRTTLQATTPGHPTNSRDHYTAHHNWQDWSHVQDWRTDQADTYIMVRMTWADTEPSLRVPVRMPNLWIRNVPTPSHARLTPPRPRTQGCLFYYRYFTHTKYYITETSKKEGGVLLQNRYLADTRQKR